jgi:hypothetical protein
MDISGIFFIEEGNTDRIYLYKEGSFWKAYERSAYLFVQHIQAYQTRLRYYKNIDQEIISIGFPDIALPKIFKTVETRLIASLRRQPQSLCCRSEKLVWKIFFRLNTKLKRVDK